jgi:hypothetical protein
MSAEPDNRPTAQARLAAVVMAVTMVLWLGAQWLGGRFDWPVRFAFLFDFAALAAFFWSLVVVYQVWRKRRDEQGN